MVGTVPTITSNPNNVTGMTSLEERPVFFLKLNGSISVNLVVKGEGDGINPLAAHAADSIKWGSKLMKGVNNDQVNTKIMTADEILGFKQAAQNFIPVNMLRPRLNIVIPGPPYTWTKMPFVQGVTTAEFYNADNTANAARARADISKMSDDQFWTDLGAVVAVDIFNGNCDRFDIKTGFWQNKGNIMFLAGGQTSVIGLDTFDPNARDLHDLTARVDFRNDMNERIKFQHLLFLVDPGERHKFAVACLKSTGSELKRAFRNKGLSQFTVPIVGGAQPTLTVVVDHMENLFDAYVPAFELGLTNGAAALKQRLQNKVQQYRPVTPWQRAAPNQPYRPPQPVPIPGKVIPQGILDRMAFLRWQV